MDKTPEGHPCTWLDLDTQGLTDVLAELARLRGSGRPTQHLICLVLYSTTSVPPPDDFGKIVAGGGIPCHKPPNFAAMTPEGQREWLAEEFPELLATTPHRASA